MRRRIGDVSGLEATFLVLLIGATLAILWFSALVVLRLFRGQS